MRSNGQAFKPKKQERLFLTTDSAAWVR